MERSINSRTVFDSPYARTNEKCIASLPISRRIEIMWCEHDDLYIWAMGKGRFS